MNKLRIGLNSLLTRIYPQPPVGGLEISDSMIRLVRIKKGNPVVHANSLPPGIVTDGRVKDKAGLTAILKEFAGASRNGRKMALVLTIPSSNVFIQTVNLPPAATRNLEEAAQLNIQMVSPIRQGEFYYDWQRVQWGEREGSPIELVGAFVSREIVNDFSDCLQEAGFSLVAVEFTSLSLVRELARKKITQPQKPYLVAALAPEGTTFMLIFNNQLLFHSFQSLGKRDEQKGAVVLTDFLAALIEEVGNVSNFYLAHWGGVVNDLVFISSGLENEIKETLKGKSLIFLKSEEAIPALGAATRSILGKKEINLLGTSSLDIFKENRALTFVALWRTIFISTLGFLLLLALGSDLFSRQLVKSVMEVNTLALNEPGHRELLALKEEAAKFNGLVSMALGARQGEPEIGRVAGLVNNLAGTEIKINRFNIPSTNAPITVSGVAVSEQAAIAFKNRLAGETGFTGVEMPISGITPETGGRVSFIIYFQAARPNSSE